MDQVRLTIDGHAVEVPAGTTILEAARDAGIYIPALCHHPDLPPARGAGAAKAVYQGDRRIENAMPEEAGKGCGLCVVEVAGEADLVESCGTAVAEGMAVITDNDRIREKRRENLIPIMARHPHACLTCAQREGCSRSQCSLNVPENERCCARFGRCELQNVADYIGIPPETPRWVPTDLPVIDREPLFIRDYNLCIGCTRCVRVCRDVRGVEAIGFVYDADGNVRVGSLAPTLEDSGCKFCTACVAVCPTGALMDKSVRPGREEADLVPCREACPARVDVPGYLRLVARGKRDEAHAVIREKIPFPGVLGRVCSHPCEAVCRRGDLNDPVSICALKRYAADGDTGLWKRNSAVREDSGKNVAVVGAGPAGLTAAFYLRKKGHGVTVFESREKAGGMMRYGIPAYRLPRDVLESEIRDILDIGVSLETGTSLGKDFTLEQLPADGFDAVFLAVGAQLSRRLDIAGSDLSDVLCGLDFLGQVAEGRIPALKDRVIVVGGGNTAVDAALTAKRCGAGEVTMVCLETREEMPAHDRAVGMALEEGVRLMPARGPRRIVADNGRVTGLETVPCVSVFDEHGNFAPAFGGTVHTIPGDQVIVAIGQAPDLAFLPAGGPLWMDRGRIVADEETLETGMTGVYAGGDVVGVPGSVIHAVAAGRVAAASIDRFLGGDGDIEEVLLERGTPDPRIGREEGFALRSREKVPESPVGDRIRDFREVALGYDEGRAVREAGRCLQCDLRLYMGANPSPPEKTLPFTEEAVRGVTEEEGVYRLYDAGHNIIAIKGTATLRRSLLAELEHNEQAAFFDVEEDRMYSQRENELIQRYLQEHGRMPGAGDDGLDDLF